MMKINDFCCKERNKFCFGFTLLELLGVIIILAIIALISVPVTLNILSDARKNAFKNSAYGLIDAVRLQYAENYLYQNFEDVVYVFPDAEGLSYSGDKPKGGSLHLADNGKISLAIYNDEWCVTKSLDESDVVIEAYVEGKCILPEEINIPVITLNGEESVYLNIGKTYTEAGYSVKTIGDEVLSNDLVEVHVLGQTTGKNEIDTSIEETYTLTYTVTYRGNVSSVIRIVHVGNYKPTVQVEPNGTDGYQKETDVTIRVSSFEKYHIDGFRYIVNKDGVDGSSVTVEELNDTISLTEDGMYTIKVIATDSEGNTNEFVSETYVIDVTDPVITFAEGDVGITMTVSEVASYDLMTGVTVTDNNLITLDNVITKGSLEASAGNYTVTYIATDVAGNVGIQERNITVVKTRSFEEVMGESSQVMSNDPDGNLRYVGSNPDNYVKFNGNELWRIIGVFDGQAKLIRNDFYSETLEWDKNSSNGGHGTMGYNDWSIATLQLELNGTFLENMDSVSKSYIDATYEWNVGGATSTMSSWTRVNMYNLERGSAVSSDRSATWEGAIGLMYPSDYGYSTSATDTECDNSMYNWNGTGNIENCKNNSWLFNSSLVQWTITPRSDHGYPIFLIRTTSRVTNDYGYNQNAVKPVVYLYSNVGIVDGTGSSEDPFILYMN